MCVYLRRLAISTLSIAEYRNQRPETALWGVWDEAIRLYFVIDYLILKVTAHSDLREVVGLLESELMV